MTLNRETQITENHVGIESIYGQDLKRNLEKWQLWNNSWPFFFIAFISIINTGGKKKTHIAYGYVNTVVLRQLIQVSLDSTLINLLNCWDDS